ncbi:hypothetical protein D3C81_785320 [compost metagenome]
MVQLLAALEQKLLELDPGLLAEIRAFVVIPPAVVNHAVYVIIFDDLLKRLELVLAHLIVRWIDESHQPLLRAFPQPFDLAVVLRVVHALLPIQVIIQHGELVIGNRSFGKHVDGRMNLQPQSVAMIDELLQQI